MPPELSHIDHWIFDLDNVLYPAECDLFALIDIKMGKYIAKALDCDLVEARKIQKRFFHDHGTTLAGLMHHHGTDPADFLDFVHDLDADLVPKPQSGAYASMIAATGIDPTRALFVEDTARNLQPAKALGMTTVWINTGAEWAGREHDPAYIDHEITDLESWVTGLHSAKEEEPA